MLLKKKINRQELRFCLSPLHVVLTFNNLRSELPHTLRYTHTRKLLYSRSVTYADLLLPRQTPYLSHTIFGARIRNKLFQISPQRAMEKQTGMFVYWAFVRHLNRVYQG